jgi:hypothetical protein
MRVLHVLLGLGSLFNHYSLLRTTEQLLGIYQFLGEASHASSMRKAFGL